MDDEFSSSPVGSDDPLAALGLVDVRTGRAVATNEWEPGRNPELNPGSGPRTPVSNPAGDDGDEGDDGEPGEPDSSDVPATPSRQVQGRQTAPNWEDDSNPYKKQFTELQTRVGATPDPAATARQNFQQIEQRLNTDRQAAFTMLTTQGIQGQVLPAPIAQVVVDSLHRAALADARIEAEHAALLPTAKQAVATDIAKRHSTGGVTITAEELMSEPTQEAMQSRARTLQETRRDSRFQSRKNGGADRAEGAGSRGTTIPEGAMDNLSPISRISLGLRRGHLGDLNR